MCFDLADGVQLYFAPQKLDKTQRQPFCDSDAELNDETKSVM